MRMGSFSGQSFCWQISVSLKVFLRMGCGLVLKHFSKLWFILKIKSLGGWQQTLPKLMNYCWPARVS